MLVGSLVSYFNDIWTKIAKLLITILYLKSIVTFV